MNVNLAWQTSILCITVVDDRITANNFSLGIDFVTNTDDTRHQNIAFERMKFMLGKIFNQSIFVSATSQMLPKVLLLSPNNLVLLPEESYDQIINLAMYCKLNAVMENMLVVDSMSISSSVNDDITYSFDDSDSLGPFAVNARKKIKPWWMRPDLRTTDLEAGHFPIDAWAEIGLSFTQPTTRRTSTTKGKKTVDTKTQTSYATSKSQVKGFHPEVILGGKNPDGDK